MKKIKYVILILCLLAGIGYFLPAVNININVPDVYRLRMKVNLGSLFTLLNESKSSGFSSSIGSVSSDDIDEIFELMRELHIESLVGGLTASMIFYILVIFILAFMLILTFMGKFNRVFITMTAIGILFYIFIAFQISSLPSIIKEALNKNLGGFSGFFDLSKGININLGVGFWLTFVAIICILSIYLYTFYKNKKNPENANGV